MPRKRFCKDFDAKKGKGKMDSISEPQQQQKKQLTLHCWDLVSFTFFCLLWTHRESVFWIETLLCFIAHIWRVWDFMTWSDVRTPNAISFEGRMSKCFFSFDMYQMWQHKKGKMECYYWKYACGGKYSSTVLREFRCINFIILIKFPLNIGYKTHSVMISHFNRTNAGKMQCHEMVFAWSTNYLNNYDEILKVFMKFTANRT